MGRPFVRRRMAAELGPDWQKRFASFDLEAAAAASLGQVHKASSDDGRELACKLQYPGIESAVEADLAQLRLIFALYRRYDSSINPELIYDEIAARLREELDYGREARHMGLYRDILGGETARPRARGGAGAVDPAAADHDLARGQAAPRASRRRPGGAQQAGAATCSGPGTSRSTSTA